MKLIRLFAAASALALSAKHAAASVVTAGIAAGVTSTQIGMDPIPWAIGAAGATVVQAHFKVDTRGKAFSNWVICIFMGGIIAPWVGLLISDNYPGVWSNDYVLAGFLSVAWPWLTPVLWERAKQAIQALVIGPAKGDK